MEDTSAYVTRGLRFSAASSIHYFLENVQLGKCVLVIAIDGCTLYSIVIIYIGLADLQ